MPFNDILIIKTNKNKTKMSGIYRRRGHHLYTSMWPKIPCNKLEECTSCIYGPFFVINMNNQYQDDKIRNMLANTFKHANLI